jgi:hypothetical protein
MAKVFIGESTDPRVLSGNPLPVLMVPYLAEQVVAIGGASVQSAAFSANTRMIRVHTDAICSIKIGADPTADANSTRMAANSTEFFDVRPGHKIAVITNT